MDSRDSQQKQSKRRGMLFFVFASLAIVLVGVIAFFTLSKIKNKQEIAAMTTQDQFESAPVVSSSLQSECQTSAVKLAKLDKIEDLEAEYKAHAQNCREVYFAIDFDSPFRKEGMYPDLAVDIAHFALETDRQKAIEILNYAKAMKAWDFYLGPVSCESDHVIDAYLESLELPAQQACIRSTEIETKLIPELEKKNFAILKTMLANNEVAWMGQPETDAGCPEKISSVISIVKKLTPSAVSVAEPKHEVGQGTDLTISLMSNEIEQVALIFKTQNECLSLKSVLIPNLEVSE